MTTRTSRNPAPAERRIELALPNLEPQPQELTRPYWLGAFPNSPLVNHDVAGIGFPRETETVRSGSTTGVRTTRIRHVGHVLHLAETQLARLADALARKVVRPVTPIVETGTGVVLDRNTGTQRAVVLTIPTPADIAAAAKVGGRTIRPYVAREGDRPLADFLFLVPCGSNTRPRPIDAELPEPLSKTGLVIE